MRKLTAGNKKSFIVFAIIVVRNYCNTNRGFEYSSKHRTREVRNRKR